MLGACCSRPAAAAAAAGADGLLAACPRAAAATSIAGIEALREESFVRLSTRARRWASSAASSCAMRRVRSSTEAPGGGARKLSSVIWSDAMTNSEHVRKPALRTAV